MATKRQIVILEEIRKQKGLHTGDQLLVVAEKDIMILKTIEKPDINQHRSLIAKTRKLVKSSGMSKQDLSDAIKTARKK